MSETICVRRILMLKGTVTFVQILPETKDDEGHVVEFKMAFVNDPGMATHITQGGIVDRMLRPFEDEERNPYQAMRQQVTDWFETKGE